VDDLLARWRLLHPGADAVAVDAWGRDLLALWQQPHRRYHDVLHLTEVLNRVDLLAHHARDADAVRLAAWTHDAVYDPPAAAGANEAASGDVAREVLTDLGHPSARDVVRLVLLTATHDARQDDPDGQVLCDADLGVLAADDERYAGYAAAVRAEYAHVPDDAFAAGRSAVLEQLLGHDRLFATSTAHDLWERRARANVEAELLALRHR
jgi:predicted metal-dependent HD superfamily phosphohydrolase